jgi:hypothetical protein
MVVIMPRTWQPMTIDEENVVAVLLGELAGVQREEIMNRLALSAGSAAVLDASLAALIAGGAAELDDASGSYRLTPAGDEAALRGTFGQ